MYLQTDMIMYHVGYYTLGARSMVHPTLGDVAVWQDRRCSSVDLYPHQCPLRTGVSIDALMHGCMDVWMH